jgi:transglutaminase-like putative cysteine protease
MGVCYHFAILNNELLNRVGIKSYLVSGYTKKGLGHEWLNVYLDDKWYSIDPTFIKTYTGDEANFLKTGKSMFFMAEITDTDSFLKDHVIDVYAKDVVNVLDIAKDVALNEVIYDNSMDDYDLIYDIALISLSIFAIAIVYKITKK